MKKVGIALSGGGIKSISQIPVIKALQDENIPIDAISGTSMGAVIASLVAVGLTADQLNDTVLSLERHIAERKIFSRPSPKILPFYKDKLIAGYVDGQELEDVLQEEFNKYGIMNISDVTIPLAIPAVDLNTGKIVCFVSHPEKLKFIDEDWIIVSDIPLAKAVRASCSFPFVIAALEYNDFVLVDGGVRMNLPLELIESYGVQKTIAVTMHSDESFNNYGSLMGVATRVMDLMRIEDDYHILKKADIHINVPLDDVWVFEIGKGKTTIDRAQSIVAEHHNDFKLLQEKQTMWERIKEELTKL